MSIFVNGVELVKLNETTYVTKSAAVNTAAPVVNTATTAAPAAPVTASPVHGVSSALLNNLTPVKAVEPEKQMLIGFSCMPEKIEVQNVSLYMSPAVYEFVNLRSGNEFKSNGWIIKCGQSYNDELRFGKTEHNIFMSERSFKNRRSNFKDVFAKNYLTLTAKDVDNLKQALTTLSATVQDKIDKEVLDKVVVLTGLENL